MLFKAKEKEEEFRRLEASLEPVAQGLGFSLVALIVSRSRGSCQARITVTKPDSGAPIGTSELGRLHKALLPRLELVLGTGFSLELSSPGIDRTIREGAEFVHFLGRNVRCYLPEKSDWVSGLLKAADTEKIVLENGEGTTELEYKRIAKAKLDG